MSFSEGTKHKQNSLYVYHLCRYVDIFMGAHVWVCEENHESYLAVKHLITCHVVKLQSVQVISTKNNKCNMLRKE